MVDELNLSCVYVSHPDEPNVLYKADSTQPDYTLGLTLNQHKLARAELAELTRADIKALGKHAAARGLALLMQRIKDESLPAKKRKKATNGKRAEETEALNTPAVQNEMKTVKVSTKARNAVMRVTQEETKRAAYVEEFAKQEDSLDDDYEMVFADE